MEFIRDLLHGQLDMHTHADGTAHSHNERGARADYSPSDEIIFMRGFYLGITVVIAALVLLKLLSSPTIPVVLIVVGVLMMMPRLLLSVFLLRYAPRRFDVVRKIQSQIPWRGDEQVLDVGTGSGILLVGCARQLTTGRAIGIDVWQANGGGGTPERFHNNVEAEGVADHVVLQNVDARSMPFENEAFDVIVSSMAMHHVGANPKDLDRATREMIRTLKPGGYMALFDVGPILDQSLKVMRQSGFVVSQQEGIAVKYVLAQKPAFDG
jgi:arsenite methyltransferase